MRSLVLAVAVSALPSIAHGQIRITPLPGTEAVRNTVILREPALYVHDAYSYDGTRKYALHFVENFSGVGHRMEQTFGYQALAADRRGNVYATVYVGDPEHTRVIQIARSGWFKGPLQRPMGIATDARGRIYITDANLGQVIRVDDLNGTNMVTFGSPGAGIGQFMSPHGVAVDSKGRIYIADTGNNRIVRIDDMNGEGWRTYDGMQHAAAGLQTLTPKAIAVDSKDRLHYLRPYNNTLARVDDIGGANPASWRGSLMDPQSIAIDASDRIYVGDVLRARIYRINDMSGAGETELHTTPNGQPIKRPSALAVFVPRIDRTIIR